MRGRAADDRRREDDIELAVERVALGLHLPRRIGWREVVVMALASSTGFTIALFFATGILSNGPVRSQLTVGALATAAGALLALGAGRLLRVGRFAS